jgi:hypothetical protein
LTLAGLPNIAAITVVRDEADMLPRWVDHYSRQCGDPERLLIVDDNSTDGSTDDLPCPVIRLPEGDHSEWAVTRLRIVNALATALLQSFDAVLFADADEFLVADPAKYADLRELLADRPGVKALGAMGMNVVHRVNVEKPLKPERPVLRQRRTAKFVPKMCKPAIKRGTAHWASGSHGLRMPYQIDPELYLFHLKFADRDHLIATSAHRRALTEETGRGADANWRLGGELVQLLDSLEAPENLKDVPWFKPNPERLANIVEQQEEALWCSTGSGQVKVMRERPLVRIPKRIVDTF